MGVKLTLNLGAWKTLAVVQSWGRYVGNDVALAVLTEDMVFAGQPCAHALPGTHKGGVDGGWDRPDGQMFPMHRWPHWLSHYVDCCGGAEDNPGWTADEVMGKAKTGWLWGVHRTEAVWCVLKPTSIQRTSRDWVRKRESNSRARFSSLLVSSDLESIKVVITCGDQRTVNDVLSLNMWTQKGLLDHCKYISWTPVNADAPPVWLECGCPGMGHSHHHRRNYLCLNSHFLYGLTLSANRRFTCQSDNVNSYWRASLILS